MHITRQIYNISTDTGGDFTDTGPPFMGMVLQLRYVPDGSTPPDTGADLNISYVESGLVVASYDNIGNQAFTKVPKQPVHDTGGQQLQGSDFCFSGSDRMRVTLNQSAGVTGNKTATLYIWTGW